MNKLAFIDSPWPTWSSNSMRTDESIKLTMIDVLQIWFYISIFQYLNFVCVIKSKLESTDQFLQLNWFLFLPFIQDLFWNILRFRWKHLNQFSFNACWNSPVNGRNNYNNYDKGQNNESCTHFNHLASPWKVFFFIWWYTVSQNLIKFGLFFMLLSTNNLVTGYHILFTFFLSLSS